MFDPINLLIGGLFFAFIALGNLLPARSFPQMKYWKIRGVLAMITYISLTTYSPFLWVDWLGGPMIFDAGRLPAWVQVILGFATIQFVSYWWHRSLHRFNILWRVFHQMHHSVERMDGWGALYHHPLDVVAFTFMGSLALTIIVGITPEAAALAAIIGMAAVYFSHSNLKTPQWIGWFIQRPETHGRHHERGRHAGNYAELVIWDQVFRTWDNPKTWNGEAGFYNGASLRIWDMLVFRDVANPDAGPPVLEKRDSAAPQDVCNPRRLPNSPH